MLELHDIRAGYGETAVLRGVTLAVPDGAVVTLLGPNGAGKTTLLRVASGLLRPDSGRIVLDGDDVTGMGSHRLARRGMCHVPEGRGIFPSLSVRENVILHAPGGQASAALDQAVDAFPALRTRLDQPA